MTNRVSPDHWNGWEIDPDIPALVYARYGYRIDLDRILTNDDIVFWVIQICGKQWPGGLDGFVNAIDDLYDPHKQMNSRWHIPLAEQPEGRYTPESIRVAVAEFIAAGIRNHSKWMSPAEAEAVSR